MSYNPKIYKFQIGDKVILDPNALHQLGINNYSYRVGVILGMNSSLLWQSLFDVEWEDGTILPYSSDILYLVEDGLDKLENEL